MLCVFIVKWQNYKYLIMAEQKCNKDWAHPLNTQLLGCACLKVIFMFPGLQWSLHRQICWAGSNRLGTLPWWNRLKRSFMLIPEQLSCMSYDLYPFCWFKHSTCNLLMSNWSQREDFCWAQWASQKIVIPPCRFRSSALNSLTTSRRAESCFRVQRLQMFLKTG